MCFLGLSFFQLKAYKVYNLVTKKVHYNRDIVFPFILYLPQIQCYQTTFFFLITMLNISLNYALLHLLLLLKHITHLLHPPQISHLPSHQIIWRFHNRSPKDIQEQLRLLHTYRLYVLL